MTLDVCRGRTECCQPVEVVSYKIGVCKVSGHGKECRTEFERMSFNGSTSVVLCRPFTGRMHQIRVHLQYLGNIAHQERLKVSTKFCGRHLYWLVWLVFRIFANQTISIL